MPTKTRGPGTIEAQGQQTSSGGGGSTYNYTSGRKWELAVGEDTPNYYARKRRGELLPFTGWLQIEEDLSTSGSAAQTHPSTGVTYFLNTIDPGIGPSSLWASYDQLIEWAATVDTDPFVQSAIASLYARGMDGLTFVAELNKTVTMLRSAITRFGTLLQATKPSDWSQAWLEGRYGWRLLAHDVKDINELLSASEEGEYLFYKEQVGSSIELPVFEIPWNTGFPGIYAMSGTTYLKRSLGVRGSCVSKIRPPRLRFDLSVTAWEVIPFSFLVDWFFTVGQSLTAMNAVKHHVDMVAGAGAQLTIEASTEIDNLVDLGGWTNSFSASCHGRQRLTSRSPSQIDGDFNPLLSITTYDLANKITDLTSLFKSGGKGNFRR